MSAVRRSLRELSASEERLAGLAAPQDETINHSDIAEINRDFWSNATLIKPCGKKQ